MEAVSVKLEDWFLEDIKRIMKKNRYSTKAEFIRESLRDKIKALEKEEALMKLRKLYGSSNRRTSSKKIHDAGERAFLELEKDLK